MKPLGTTYRKNTFHYEQIVREGNIAIFKQRLRPGEGCLAYEVIHVRQDPEREIAGVIIPAHERAPGNEDWGKFGFTLPTLESARAKMKEMLEAEKKEKK